MKNSAPARARCAVTGGRPDVFAHRHADRDAAEIHGVGQRSRRKHALLVEDAVVRQIGFESRRGRALVDDDRGVVDAAVLAPRRRGDERRRAVAFAHETVDRRVTRVDHRRTQHQIFGWIADDSELGQHDEIGSGRRGALARARRIRARLPSMSPTVGLS